MNQVSEQPVEPKVVVQEFAQSFRQMTIKSGDKNGPTKKKEPRLLYIGVDMDLSKIETLINSIRGFNPTRFDSLKKRKEFHVTLLYVGGKPNQHTDEFTKYLNKPCTVVVDGYGLTDDACCFSVKEITCENEIVPCYTTKMHITIALADGISPAASVNAILGDNLVYAFDDCTQTEVSINGVIKEYK